MSKKQKRAINKKVDEFSSLDTPRERTMQIAKELLRELQPNDYKLKSKTNIVQKIETKIKYCIQKIKKVPIPQKN